ncbi:Copper transport protein ATX1, partial [Ananas comosus]
MASGEAEPLPDPPQSKTVVLKVFIHCPGCKKKVQRIVKRIDGVSTCEVDAPHNKVTVTGNVDADYLIKKLLKSGKQADLWPEPKIQNPPPTTAPQNPNPNPNPNTTQKKEPHPPKETSDKSQKTPSETPKEIDTKPAKEPQKPSDEPKKSAKEDDPKPDESKTQSSSEAPPAKIPTSGEEAGSSTRANKKEKKGQNSKPADNKREADSAAPPPDVRMHQMYLPPPPAAIVSYNTAQPSTSHAYYAPAPMPHMMSQGYAAAPVPHMMPQGYAAAPVPHMMPQDYAAAPVPHMMPQGYTYAPYYAAPQPQQLPLEDLYYGPPGSRLSSPPRDQYEYAVFNDENANSCNV